VIARVRATVERFVVRSFSGRWPVYWCGCSSLALAIRGLPCRVCVIFAATLDRARPIRTGGIRPTLVAAIGFAVFAGAMSVVLDARAAEVTRVLSGFDDAKRFDLNVSLTWIHEQKRAAIKREQQSAASTSQDRLVNDLLYQQTRDVMNARIEMGVHSDVGLHIDLPYVLRDDRGLSFDQHSSSTCAAAGQPGTPGCVNEFSSTLLRDGILPGAGQPMYGVDATAGGAGFSRPSSKVFQGPRRSGLESLGVGLTWAAMNQSRDDTKPTWVLAIDGKFDVGTIMRYDAAHPSANTAVGLGYHQVIASTFISKRLGSMDPYFGAYYALPLPGGNSPFDRFPLGGQPYAGPQQRTGVQFGFEFVPWERAETSQRVTLEVRTRADHRFQGSNHSELWEALAGSSACDGTNPTACRAGIDLDLTGDGVLDHPHPGVTETQAYSTFGGDVGLNIQASRAIRFRGLFGLSSDLPHFITFATAGSDSDGDGVVDSTKVNEANPRYREAIDLPGRRFKVDGTQIWNLSVELAVQF
jgi:hypothetical protein